MKAMKEMPSIDVDNILSLTEDEKNLVRGILNKGRLRASKPKVPDTIKVPNPERIAGHDYAFSSEEDRRRGYIAYIWREVAFCVSPYSQHHCMPVCNDFNLEGSWTEKQPKMDELKKIVDKVINSIPKSQWYGIARWSRAFGA